MEFKKELDTVLKKLGYYYKGGYYLSPSGTYAVHLGEFTVTGENGRHVMVGSV